MSFILIFSSLLREEHMLAFISLIDKFSYNLAFSNSSLEYFKSNIIEPWAKLWKLSEAFLFY